MFNLAKIIIKEGILSWNSNPSQRVYIIRTVKSLITKYIKSGNILLLIFFPSVLKETSDVI